MWLRAKKRYRSFLWKRGKSEGRTPQLGLATRLNRRQWGPAPHRIFELPGSGHYQIRKPIRMEGNTTTSRGGHVPVPTTKTRICREERPPRCGSPQVSLRAGGSQAGSNPALLLPLSYHLDSLMVKGRGIMARAYQEWFPYYDCRIFMTLRMDLRANRYNRSRICLWVKLHKRDGSQQ